jgi:hypothetical protein
VTREFIYLKHIVASHSINGSFSAITDQYPIYLAKRNPHHFRSWELIDTPVLPILLACSEYHALIYDIMHKQKTTLGNNLVEKMIQVSTYATSLNRNCIVKRGRWTWQLPERAVLCSEQGRRPGQEEGKEHKTDLQPELRAHVHGVKSLKKT